MPKERCDLSAAAERRRILRAWKATTGVGARPTRVVANEQPCTISKDRGNAGASIVRRLETYFARPLYPVDSIWTFHAALRPTM